MKRLASILSVIAIVTVRLWADYNGGNGGTATPPNTVSFMITYPINTVNTYDLTQKTTATNDDPILDFNLSGTVPSFVTLTGANDHILSIKPVTGDRGIYTFTYQAQDKDGWSDPGTITLFITNAPPKVDMPDFNFSEGDPALNISIPSHTTTTDGDPILKYAWLAGDLPAGLSWSGSDTQPPNSTVYFDGEDKTVGGWEIYDNTPSGATIANVYDYEKESYVLEFNGTGTKNGIELPNWNNTTQHVLSWDMKFGKYIIYLWVETDRSKYALMTYNYSNSTHGGMLGTVHHGLGYGTIDGRWHTITRDLDSDLQEFQPGNHIRKVKYIQIRGYGRLDNVKLSDTPRFDSTGVFSGSPTESGVYTISVGAQDRGGIGVDTFTLRVFSPPVTRDVLRGSITKKVGSTWNLNLPGHGDTGIRRTDGDKILAIQEANNTNATYLHLDTTSSAGGIGKTGHVKLDKAAPPGTYSLKFRAQDKDGWSNWSKYEITVSPGTPPITHKVTYYHTQGSDVYWYLRGNGGVTRTEKDKITAFLIRNKDDAIAFDGNISDVYGKRGRVSLDSTTPSGTYTMEFKACDEDGCSKIWRKCTVKITKQPAPIIKNIKIMRTIKTDVPYDLSKKTTPTDGDPILNYRLLGTIPPFVTLEGDHNQTLRIKPVTGDRGIYTFQYQAQDKDGWSFRKKITLFIINNPPKVDMPDINGTKGTPLTINVAPHTTQTNGDPIIDYAWLSGKIPAGLSWSSGDSNPPNYKVYEDAQNKNTKGWVSYTKTKGTITNVYDGDKHSRVIDLNGSGVASGYRLRTDSNKDWHDTRHVIRWDMKFSEDFRIMIRVLTQKGYDFFMTYLPADAILHAPGGVRHAIGKDKKDGKWHTITRDLDSDFQEFRPGDPIKEVWAFYVRGSGRLDNIRLYDDSHYDPAGTFSGTPTEQGTYTIAVGARDRGGVGVDTFKLHIIGPPITKNRSFHKKKNQGLAAYWLNISGGDSGIKRTDGDKILEIQEANNTAPAYLHLDKDTDNKYGKIGNFTIDKETPPGSYTLKFRARDKDGWSNWSIIHVVIDKGTPPVASYASDEAQPGTNILHYLNRKNNNGGIARTEEDPIEAFQIKNKDPKITFDGTTGSKAYGKYGIIKLNSTVPSGTYTMEFRALDADGWSDWATYKAIISVRDHTSDVCYNEPTYNSTSKCKSDPLHSAFKGGAGCRQTIRLTNRSSRSLTHAYVYIDQTPDNDIPMKTCKTLSNGKSCEGPKKYYLDTRTLDKGLRFIMSDFAPDGNQSIEITTASTVDDNDTRAMMDGTNFYIEYKDSGISHVSKIPFCAGTANYAMDVDSNFSLVYGGEGTAVLGDIAATGDSILYVKGGGNTQNNDNYTGPLWDANTSYILTDPAFGGASDGNKSNASTATLTLPSCIKSEHIKWAGLFWQGYVHETHESNETLDTIKASLASRQWNTVKIKASDGNSTVVTADLSVKDLNSSTHHLLVVDKNSYRFFYGAYKNITDFVKGNLEENSTTQTFTVGNILTTAGRDYMDSLYIPHADEGNGRWNLDGFNKGSDIGYFGGWSLIVVYDLIGTPEAATCGSSESYKNVSLYKGYDFFLTAGDGNVSFDTNISLSGFKTPSSGTVRSRLLFFGGGADKSMTPDILQMQNKTDTSSFVDITNGKNPAGGQFNSTYTIDGNEINPAKTNHQGMDLDIFDVSSHMGNKQSATKIRFGVKKIQTGSDPSAGYCDEIFPQVLGFSTELYIPKLCYDFNIYNGEHYRLPVQDDRNFTTSKIGSDPLIFGIMLKSRNADFDLINSKGGITFQNNPALTFRVDSSLYSPPSINAFLPAIDANNSRIALGESATALGGVIGSNEVNYAKFYYTFDNNNPVSDQFDLEVRASVQFSSGSAPIPFVLTTGGDSSNPMYIERCAADKTYDPVPLWFNVERPELLSFVDDKTNFPLYTHVTGQDFGVSIASYSGPNFQTPHAYNSTVELEMINADTFENNKSNGYDSICQNPDANAIFGEGKLFDFGTTNKTRLVIPSFDSNMSQIDRTVASRNATYRLWVLTARDDNSTMKHIVSYHETDKTRFKPIYDSVYRNKDDNTTHFCGDGATKPCDTNVGTECYECLKKYFATPVCARDNFAIRPEGFRIEVGDANGTDTNSSITPIPLTDNESPVDVKLSAGYKYRISATAKSLGYTPSKGYTNFISSDSNATTGDHAQLVFNTAASGSGCFDKKSYGQALTFFNSDTNNTPSNVISTNTGTYQYGVTDINWTNVDRADYPYKTAFGTCKNPLNATNPSCNDCVLGSKSPIPNSNNKVGCETSSFGVGTGKYNQIPLTFEPYKFDVTAAPELQNEANITVGSTTTYYLFMNDFGNDYYKDPTVQSIDNSVVYKGEIIARGKDGGILSNFIGGCSASDVKLYLDINDTNITDVNYTLQTYLQIGDETEDYNTTQDLNITDHSTTNHKTGIIILPKSAFNNTNTKGAAKIVINSTIRKPAFQFGNQGVNPIVLTYNKLAAEDPNATSSVDMVPTHIPQGENNTSLSVTYLYGKITPGRLTYMNVTGATRRTALYVDIYCAGSPECTKPYLSTPTWGADEDKLRWHLSTLFDEYQIGTIKLNASNSEDANNSHYIITVPTGSIKGLSPNSGNPLTDVLISNPKQGMQQDINITLKSSVPRPSTVTITYTPKPWLVHDPSKDFYRVHFIGGGTWNGVGKTGKTIRTRSGTTGVPRMNW